LDTVDDNVELGKWGGTKEEKEDGAIDQTLWLRYVELLGGHEWRERMHRRGFITSYDGRGGLRRVRMGEKEVEVTL
jgi:hypothetical protein